MFAFSRKNLSCLIRKSNSCACKSLVPLQFFSTSGEKIIAKNPVVYDLLVHKYQFSPPVASMVASELCRCRSPEAADSALSFLKESGFSSIQLQKIAEYRPRFLSAGSQDDIKFKIKIFQDLGLSPEDIAKVISRHLRILTLSARNNIIPSLSLIEDLLGSNHDVATLLTKYPRFLIANLENTLIPNVELLKSCGINMDQIRILLSSYSGSLLIKSDVFRKSVDKAKEMGFSQSSRMFIYAVQSFASLSKENWEAKWQAFQNLGFSDSDILTMFKRMPRVFKISTEKVEKIKELLLATGKFTLSSIVDCPEALTCSVEKRYKPRLRVLATLEIMNLITKWPSLSTVCTATDDRFFKSYIGPYLDELDEEYARESNVKGKGR